MFIFILFIYFLVLLVAVLTGATLMPEEQMTKPGNGEVSKMQFQVSRSLKNVQG